MPPMDRGPSRSTNRNAESNWDGTLRETETIKRGHLPLGKVALSTRPRYDRRLADEGRKSQELLSKSAQVGAERLQKQKLEYDAWKQVLEDKIKDRIASVKALKMAMAQVFDSFESLLADAQHKDDHLILNPLSLCISALSEMDKAVKEASKIAQSRAEKARVNRLRVMKKFFLGVILDLTRRKSERSAQRELFESLSKRLSRRREIAERHIDIVLQSVSTPPSDA